MEQRIDIKEEIHCEDYLTNTNLDRQEENQICINSVSRLICQDGYEQKTTCKQCFNGRSVDNFCSQCLKNRNTIDYKSPPDLHIKQEIKEEIQEEELHIENVTIKTEFHIEEDLTDVRQTIKSENTVDSNRIDPLAVGICENVGTKSTQVNTENKPIQENFMNSDSIQDSNEFVIRENKKSRTCYICNKTFQFPSHLALHLRIHTGTRPFQCHFCSKTFIKHSALKVHIRIHTGEKPFKCHICKKQFVQSSQCKQHIRMHTGDKPYECAVCGKKFVNYSHLVEHLRVHTGERPYDCIQCNKKFSRASTLSRHLRTHTAHKTPNIM